MSRIVGAVTRVSPDTIVPSQQSSQGNRAIFSATTANQTLGSFRSAREAQVAVEAALGGTKARWTREDLAGRIERYVGRTGRPDPKEIYGVDLLAWSEADGGVVFVPTGGPDILRWGDRSGNRNNQVSLAGDEPILVEAGLSSRNTIRFEAGQTDQMTTALTVDPSQDVTLTLLVAPDVAGVDQVMGRVGTGPALELVLDAGGTINLLSSGAPIVGPAFVLGVPVVVQAVHRPATAEVELFVNNVSAGVETPATFGAGLYQLSDPVDPYQGRISVGVLSADSDDRKRELTYRYLQERYRTA